MLSLNLSNKTILITGASDGIGKSMASFLLKMGANVAIHYNSNKKNAVELTKGHPKEKWKIFKADLSIHENVISLFSDVKKYFNKIDVIILNAGVYIAHEIDLENEEWMSIWNKTMNINLNSAGLLTKLGIQHFKKNNNGSFIYISSRAANRGETEEYLGYAASKGGLTSLAKSVARSFGKHNVKSFVIAPGFVKTKMADSFINKYGEKRVIDELSLNELTKPDDLNGIIGLLCSGLMDHATGTTIDINAGSYIR
jgi:NAD(P)-dependent dehydrogenase (short-subunit alcohol dehydrogenase family)